MKKRSKLFGRVIDALRKAEEKRRASGLTGDWIIIPSPELVELALKEKAGEELSEREIKRLQKLRKRWIESHKLLEIPKFFGD